MPLPLILGIGAALAGITGIASTIKGASDMKNANDTMKELQARNERNIKKFEIRNKAASVIMDDLGKMELKILQSFEEFSDLIEKIQNRPEFKDFSHERIQLPQYDPERLKEVSVGAGVLLGSLGSAAVGTAGGFAAAGATTAAVMALGTASTGTLISSLSGAAATNAVLAALGGGALAAGGGGMALGSMILGGATLGVGLLVGGIIFGLTGHHISEKADEARHQVIQTEEKINAICEYLIHLERHALKFQDCLKTVNHIYQNHMDMLRYMINTLQDTDWNAYNDNQKIMVQNTVLLVALLYKMCQVGLVLKSENSEELNRVNVDEINTVIEEAQYLLADRGLG